MCQCNESELRSPHCCERNELLAILAPIKRDVVER
jgi:hypothetical protein